MKKIILAFDGPHYSQGAFDFARRLNELQPVILRGLFLPQVDFSHAWVYMEGATVTSLPVIEGYDEAATASSIHAFEQECLRYGIAHDFRQDRDDLAMPALRTETRFADLLIVGSERFYANLGVTSPNDYLKMALLRSECPVILAPEQFTFPESVVLAYDGSEDAMFAIRQFACLFPELCTRKTVLVYATPKSGRNMPEPEHIRDFASRHFPNLTLEVLEAEPRKYFGTWINDIHHPIVVCGAYGRSGFSEAFRTSFIAEVITDHKVPVFITHR
ncbi:universal stress protein [Chitinophaga pollutisoli]|uniref:Universal stress protein n=1 Tax=Chitinophaga pollutisoli TaxID=3133966 RepID=A0ABZ2YM55_9BACT